MAAKSNSVIDTQQSVTTGEGLVPERGPIDT